MIVEGKKQAAGKAHAGMAKTPADALISIGVVNAQLDIVGI